LPPLYRLVMFDFDGTLADTFPWFLQVFDQVADRFAFRRLDPAATESLRGLDARAIMRQHKVPAWKVPFIARHARALMAQNLSQFSLFPGISQMLGQLHAQGTIVALVTSNSWSNVAAVLKAENIAFFRHFECGISMFGKASKLRRLVRRLKVPAEQSLFVGDEIRDAEAARKAGIPFGAVAWGYSRPEALAARGPQEFFAHVDDLARLVAPPAAP
jgi:phosphoglycolate phosphatase